MFYILIDMNHSVSYYSVGLELVYALIGCINETNMHIQVYLPYIVIDAHYCVHYVCLTYCVLIANDIIILCSL